MAIKKLNVWHNERFNGYVQVKDVWNYTIPAIDNDEFLVYVNDDNQQACVYWKRFNGGQRICLAQHMDVIMNLLDNYGCDHLFYSEIEKLAADKAEAAGFPRTWHEITQGITWRELIAQLEEHPELLDEPARVWVPTDLDIGNDQYPGINGVTPYIPSQPASRNNFLSIDIQEL